MRKVLLLLAVLALSGCCKVTHDHRWARVVTSGGEHLHQVVCLDCWTVISYVPYPVAKGDTEYTVQVLSIPYWAVKGTILDDMQILEEVRVRLEHNEPDH